MRLLGRSSGTDLIMNLLSTFFRPNKAPLYLHHVVLCYLRKRTAKSKGPFKSLGALHIIKTIRSECQVGCLEKIKKFLRAVSLI